MPELSRTEATNREERIAEFVSKHTSDVYALRRAAEMLNIIRLLTIMPKGNMWAIERNDIRDLENAVADLKRQRDAIVWQARLDNLWERFIW